MAAASASCALGVMLTTVAVPFRAPALASALRFAVGAWTESVPVIARAVLMLALPLAFVLSMTLALLCPSGMAPPMVMVFDPVPVVALVSKMTLALPNRRAAKREMAPVVVPETTMAALVP